MSYRWARCGALSSSLDSCRLISSFCSFSSKHALFSSASIFSFVSFKFKDVFVKVLILFIIFVKLYLAGTFCARLRARLLVCFDRPVG